MAYTDQPKSHRITLYFSRQYHEDFVEMDSRVAPMDRSGWICQAIREKLNRERSGHLTLDSVRQVIRQELSRASISQPVPIQDEQA